DRDSGVIALVHFQRRPGSGILDPDQRHPEGIEIRVIDRIGRLANDVVSLGSVHILDPVGRDEQIPMGILVGLKPEGSPNWDQLGELVDKLPGCVNLFSYQWFLIHGSTPSAGSVIAW